ncbi:MAG: four-carbon acid sugar kinase family protein [Tepidisphaeraceae bacterium]
MSKLLLGYYGDDFTGSTDALEALTLAGVPAVLFTRPPTAADLSKYPHVRAIGIAGQSRSMNIDDADRELRPAFECLRDTGAGIVHHKVCSTFDSSPTIGNVGRVMELGLKVFGEKIVPVVVGAPDLGRHCAFGNLFARFGNGEERFRLDRHPSISKHPVTPMTEADLRWHLNLQTLLPVGLLDVLQLDRPNAELISKYEAVCHDTGEGAVLIDLVTHAQLDAVGTLLIAGGRRFVVGSSGVESALCAAWLRDGVISKPPALPPPGEVGPIIAVCGSCSPVTAAQIEFARESDFAEVVLGPQALATGAVNSAIANAVALITHALENGRSVVLHTEAGHRVEHTSAEDNRLGESLGHALRLTLERTPAKRVVIAGGDTSGHIARALNITALELISPLTRARRS